MQNSKLQPITENFEHITLTDEETADALRAGREKKHYMLKQIEYRERLARKATHPTFTADELFSYFSMQYTVDDVNVKIITNICRYFSEDPQFEGDLGKGLFIMGGVGVGKTSLMKFFMKNQRFSYRIDACREVETNYAQLGDNYIDSRSFNMSIAVNSDIFGHQIIGFCFDDLGTEGNGKYYGKEKNVMAEILLNRYDNQLPFISTHVTTNLTAEQVKEQYGSRVTDRLRQMFNVIKFPVDAKSRR